ncbi:6032_t:CDS:2 [Funneliformis geosporum]|nr:6032_t:CDS:2 [Funneliformis geosporum]
MLDPIEISILDEGEVKKTLKELTRKAELMIIKEIAENLRKEISNYRKTEAKRLGSEQNEVIKNQHTTINLDNYFEQQEQTPASSRTNLLSKIQQEEIELQKVEQKALQIQPAYGTPSSSKPK